MTIDQIAERLAVSRGSVYGWVRDLPFDANRAKRSAAQLKAARANSERARARREEAYDRGRSEYPTLVTEPTFRDFLCLYWAEGCKRQRHRVSLGNSDVAIVRLSQCWMARFTARPMRYRIQYHVDQDLAELREWWAHALTIEPSEIGLQRKSNSNHLTGRTWRSEHGVLTVTTGDTLFRARLQGWLDTLRAEWLLDSAASGCGAAW